MVFDSVLKDNKFVRTVIVVLIPYYHYSVLLFHQKSHNMLPAPLAQHSMTVDELTTFLTSVPSLPGTDDLDPNHGVILLTGSQALMSQYDKSTRPVLLINTLMDIMEQPGTALMEMTWKVLDEQKDQHVPFDHLLILLEKNNNLPTILKDLHPFSDMSSSDSARGLIVSKRLWASYTEPNTNAL